MLSQLKYEFVRTPLEGPLVLLRRLLAYPARWRHPELREVFLEEERVPAALRHFVGPTSNCIDIGCHYGSMLSQLCRLAPGGRHVAFEAIPSKARFLRRKFPDVDIRELALSDHGGSTEFYVNQDAPGFSGLAPHGAGRFERLQVECARLDDVLPRDRRFTFVKIDVEGAELFVFRGATEFLVRDRPVVLFECAPGIPSAFGYGAGDIYDFLSLRCRYSIFFLKDVLARGTPATKMDFEAALVYPFKAFNWIGVPSEGIGRSA